MTSLCCRAVEGKIKRERGDRAEGNFESRGGISYWRPHPQTAARNTSPTRLCSCRITASRAKVGLLLEIQKHEEILHLFILGGKPLCENVQGHMVKLLAEMSHKLGQISSLSITSGRISFGGGKKPKMS